MTIQQFRAVIILLTTTGIVSMLLAALSASDHSLPALIPITLFAVGIGGVAGIPLTCLILTWERQNRHD